MVLHPRLWSPRPLPCWGKLMAIIPYPKIWFIVGKRCSGKADRVPKTKITLDAHQRQRLHCEEIRHKRPCLFRACTTRTYSEVIFMLKLKKGSEAEWNTSGRTPETLGVFIMTRRHRIHFIFTNYLSKCLVATLSQPSYSFNLAPPDFLFQEKKKDCHGRIFLNFFRSNIFLIEIF